jgi:hypothetical protein
MSTQVYRPGSGTEGMDFTSKWCSRCMCDANEDCPILAATFVYEIADPKYPSEWRYERGEPVCSAFEASDPLDQPFLRSAACSDLFKVYERPSIGAQVRLLVLGSAL